MSYEIWRGEPLLSTSVSPHPLFGEYGCIRFKDLRKETQDWAYLPVESREELSTYLDYMKNRPGEYKTPTFMPSPRNKRS